MATKPEVPVILASQYLKVAALLERWIAHTAKRHGLNSTELLILLIADGQVPPPATGEHRHGEVTATSAAELTGYSLARIGAQLERLLARGLIGHTKPPPGIGKKRSTVYRLTRKGQEIVLRARPLMEVLELVVRQETSRGSNRARSGALDRLVDRVDREIQSLDRAVSPKASSRHPR